MFNTYSDLWPVSLDEVTDAITRQRERSLADSAIMSNHVSEEWEPGSRIPRKLNVSKGLRGVANAVRTRDLLNHNQMLYLLSYSHHAVLIATRANSTTDEYYTWFTRHAPCCSVPPLSSDPPWADHCPPVAQFDIWVTKTG